MISIIAAMADNRVIGKNNRLPWFIPNDLAYFKRTTMGHPVIMGRKTFESLGKPLPGRENIILTRDPGFQAEGCQVKHSVDEILIYAANQPEEEMFIIGGASVYPFFLPYSDRLYLTRIHHVFEGDVFFPEVREDDWILLSKVRGEVDPDNPFEYDFLIYTNQTGSLKKEFWKSC